MDYRVNLAPDDNGTMLVTCPDFPEIATFGEDTNDALMRAMDALDEAIASRIADREDIPSPATGGRLRVAVRPLTAIKATLYKIMREQGVTKAELARRLAWHGPQVDRVLDIQHASRIDQLAAALAALGKKLDIDVTDA